MQKTVSTITPFSASAQAQKTPFTFDYIRSCTNPYKFRITEHIYLFVVPVIIEVKTAQQITDFTSGIKLLWNTVRTPHQSKLPSPSSMPPSNFRCPNLHVTISQKLPTIVFQSLLHGSANQRRFGPSTSDWTAKAIIYFKGLSIEAILRGHKTGTLHRRAIIKFHFKSYILYTTNMFYSKLDAANAQWPEFQDRLRRILLKIFEAQSNPARRWKGLRATFSAAEVEKLSP